MIVPELHSFSQQANLEAIIKLNWSCTDGVCVCAPSHLPEGLHSVLPAHLKAGGADLSGHTGLLQPAHSVQLPGRGL